MKPDCNGTLFIVDGVAGWNWTSTENYASGTCCWAEICYSKLCKKNHFLLVKELAEI